MDADELHASAIVIDGLEICNWNRSVFEDMRRGGLTAVNCTCVVWEGFHGGVFDGTGVTILCGKPVFLIVHSFSSFSSSSPERETPLDERRLFPVKMSNIRRFLVSFPPCSLVDKQFQVL